MSEDLPRSSASPLASHLEALQHQRREKAQSPLALEAAQAALQSQADDPLAGELHFELGSAYLTLSRWQEAFDHLQAASPLLPERAGVVLHRLGRAAQELGQLEAARDYYQQALAHKTGPAGKTRHQLGRVLESLNQTDEAIKTYELALRELQAAGLRRELGISAYQLGRLQQQHQNWSAAQSAFETARSELGSEADMRAEVCYLLGEVAIQLGVPEQAETRLSEALSIHRHLKNQTGVGMALLKLCQAQMLQRKWKDVLTSVREAITALEGTRERSALKLACELQGELFELLGKPDEARQWFSRAETL